MTTMLSLEDVLLIMGPALKWHRPVDLELSICAKQPAHNVRMYSISVQELIKGYEVASTRCQNDGAFIEAPHVRRLGNQHLRAK
jgi:hypothetical protein